MTIALALFIGCFGFFALAWVAARYLADFAIDARSAVGSLFACFAYYVCGVVGGMGALVCGIGAVVAVVVAIASGGGPE